MKHLLTKLNLPELGTHVTFTGETLGATALLQEAIRENKVFHKFHFSGYRSKNIDFYRQEFKKMGGVEYYSTHYDNYNSSYFYWGNENTAIADLSLNPNEVFVTIYTIDERLGQGLISLMRSYSDKPKKKGYIFAIMNGGNGLQLTRIGYAGAKLEEENYTPEVIEDYKFVINDLKSTDPSGRIVIMNGMAGGGKSFLIRALLKEVPDAMFVLVPPSMVASMSGPDLLPMLLENRQVYKKTGPTIFILEDADQVLAPRMNDNINSISSLLNMGDGIFGSLFDIRIVATTNAKTEALDEAIVRPGRLSKKITIGPLAYEQANKVFRRLVGKDLDLPTKEIRSIGFERGVTTQAHFSLAEIYKSARENGWTNENKDEEHDLNFK